MRVPSARSHTIPPSREWLRRQGVRRPTHVGSYSTAPTQYLYPGQTCTYAWSEPACSRQFLVLPDKRVTARVGSFHSSRQVFSCAHCVVEPRRLELGVSLHPRRHSLSALSFVSFQQCCSFAMAQCSVFVNPPTPLPHTQLCDVFGLFT